MRAPAMMTLTEARSRLLDVAVGFERAPAQAIQVTRRGRRVMTLLPSGLWDALVETLEVLSDPEAAARLRSALTALDSGKGVAWSKARRAFLK